MPEEKTMGYRLIQDEPWTFLDARHNPVHGRKLTYRLADGTAIEIDLTLDEYHAPATVKARLTSEIAAHAAIAGL